MIRPGLLFIPKLALRALDILAHAVMVLLSPFICTVLYVLSRRQLTWREVWDIGRDTYREIWRERVLTQWQWR